LRKLKETAGSAKYLIESDVTAGPTYRLFGVPVTVTNKLPVGKAVLADTSQIAVARDLAPRRSAPERPLRLVASRRCLLAGRKPRKAGRWTPASSTPAQVPGCRAV
jgi:hypothetical protein